MREHIGPIHRRTIIEVGLYVLPIGLALYQGTYIQAHPVEVFLAILSITVVGKYIITHRPLVKFRNNALNNFVDNYLEMIQSDFEQWHQEEIDVRVNIMQPTRQTRLSLGGHGG